MGPFSTNLIAGGTARYMRQSREKRSEQVAQDEKIKQSSSSFFLLLIFCVFADGFAYMNGHLLDDYRQGRSNVITHVKIFFYFFFFLERERQRDESLTLFV